MNLIAFNGDSTYNAYLNQKTYDVNSSDEVVTWTDGNFITHQHKVREKITGSFSLEFYSQSDYQTFVSMIDGLKTTDNTILMDLAINNKGLAVTSNVEVFIEHEPEIVKNRLGEIIQIVDNIEITEA